MKKATRIAEKAYGGDAASVSTILVSIILVILVLFWFSFSSYSSKTNQ